MNHQSFMHASPALPHASIGILDAAPKGLTLSHSLQTLIPWARLHLTVLPGPGIPPQHHLAPSLRQRAEAMAALLTERDCSVMLIGCADVAVAARSSLQWLFPAKWMDVIESGTRAAVQSAWPFQPAHIGVITTSHVQQDGAYERAIKAMADQEGLQIAGVECIAAELPPPLLAHESDSSSHAAIDHWLHLLLEGFCTRPQVLVLDHPQLLPFRSRIARAFPGCRLVDPVDQLARDTWLHFEKLHQPLFTRPHYGLQEILIADGDEVGHARLWQDWHCLLHPGEHPTAHLQQAA